MSTTTMLQTAWLFTRENESVRLEVEVGEAGAQMFVSGPGTASSEYDFNDAASLEGFRLNYERDLVERGFRLQAVAERRMGSERRTRTREESSTDRRRARN